VPPSWLLTLAGVDPDTPTVETSPAAHIAAIVRRFILTGVSQVKLWL
jgi:hypothetical protein